ncbi:MAG TPA: PDZ domain-containing protein [Polyangiaceae bacterium]|nr:PDZ domain-containing protein [Polyangiaceae bacterium]
MKLRWLAPACLAGFVAAEPARGGTPGAASLPQLPGQTGPTTSPSDPDSVPASAPLTPQQLYDRFRRGIVAIERGGMPVALGTVLAGDGRILTALSGLAGADAADVHYADGTRVHATLGQSDKDQDLALLVPQSRKGEDGLVASESDPLATELRAILPTRGAHLGPAGVGVHGPAEAHAKDGEPLLQMLDLDLKGPPVAGAPLLDLTGRVVAVLVRACKGSPPSADPGASATVGAWPTADTHASKATPAPAACLPIIVGAPVSAIRAFLSKTPVGAPVAGAPWLGIRGEPHAAGGVRGVRVVAVAPASPAEKAGLKPGGDVIVAVDGEPVDSPEQLSEVLSKRAAGNGVHLLVFGGDKFRELGVVLRTGP